MPEEYYRDAKKKAQKEFRACVMRGEHPYLPRLDEILPPEQLVHGIDLGIVQVPTELIVGSKTCGRTRAFARNFMPLLDEHTEFAQKWQRLCEAHLEEGIRDSITTFEYLNRFYVEEGNKRASVLKYFNAASIPARVTRILPVRNGSREIEAYYAFVDFYRYSHVNFIEFSRPESYNKLQKIIGKTPGESWTQEEQRKFGTIYYYFRQAYYANGGKKLNSTVGDALLAYLQVYGYQDLKGRSESDIKKSVAKVWEEIILQQEEPTIDIQLNPQENQKIDQKILSKVLPKIGGKILKAAFVHDKNPEISGWTYGHELGRRHVEEFFNQDGKELETTAYFDAFNNKNYTPEEILEQAIADGNSIIFTTSPRLLPASLRVAVEHPEIKILNCSLNTPHRYIRTYYARMYEAKFISGAIAGTLAGGDSIGYLCDYPIFGQVAGINAFALGVQMTNPRARVYLEWSSACIDCGQDGVAVATKRLTDRGIRLISSQDLASLGNPANNTFGLSLIFDGEYVNLATPQWRWGRYYESLIKQIRNRSFDTAYTESGKALNYYWGMSAGVVELKCSEKLPDSTRRLADLLRDSICSGFCDPFRGPLYAQNGRLVEEHITDPEFIISMDWLNENIVGEIPVYTELDETGKATVDIVGVGHARENANKIETARQDLNNNKSREEENLNP